MSDNDSDNADNDNDPMAMTFFETRTRLQLLTCLYLYLWLSVVRMAFSHSTSLEQESYFCLPLEGACILSTPHSPCQQERRRLTRQPWRRSRQLPQCEERREHWGQNQEGEEVWYAWHLWKKNSYFLEKIHTENSVKGEITDKSSIVNN